MKKLEQLDNVIGVQITGIGRYLVSARIGNPDKFKFATKGVRLNINEDSSDCLLLLANLRNVNKIAINAIDTVKQIECNLTYCNHLLELKNTERYLNKCAFKCLLDIARLIEEVDNGIHN